MNKAVARLKILHLCRRLYEVTDLAQQETLYRLLVEEEAKLDAASGSVDAAFRLPPTGHRVGL